MKKIIFILFFCFLYPDNQKNTNRHNLSIGFPDDKTGISMIGYTYSIKQNEMDEYFIGGGTAVLAFTGSIGWKHYYTKSKFSTYSVLTQQVVAHLGFSGFMSTISLSSEYDLIKWMKLKFGGYGAFIIRTDEDKIEIGFIPFVGFSFNF